jgi:ABC-type transport system involved in multi-copper enzyme maturation permease subunit
MTFLALLTKEMRLRLRQERNIWVIIAYILCMGLLGWISLTNNNNYTTSGGSRMDEVGLNLYSLLIQLQLFLLIFIAPTFMVTTINGEKEHQTFEMLICSRLSSLALISGKLIAGLASTIILVFATIPLFSMIFFFGGVSLAQISSAFLVCFMTIIFVGTMSIFCSTLFRRPSISTVITYTFLLVWLLLPLIITHILITTGNTPLLQQNSNATHILLSWNPLIALTSTYPSMGTSQLFAFLSYGFALGYGNTDKAIPFFSWNISPWLLYSGINLIIALILFLLCLPLIRIGQTQRLVLPRYWPNGHS